MILIRQTLRFNAFASEYPNRAEMLQGNLPKQEPDSRGNGWRRIFGLWLLMNQK